MDEPFNHSSGIVKGKRDTGANTFPLDGCVEPFQFAVGLGIIRRCPHMRHTRDADEFLEILGNKLWAVIGNDPWSGFRKALFGALKDDLHIHFRHLFPDLPMNDEATASIENTAQIIECATDVDIRNIHMPMVMGPEWLHKAGSLEAFLPVPLLQQPCLAKNSPGAAGADGNDVLIEHHERQPPIPLKGIVHRKIDDGFPLPRFKPEIAGNQPIMFVGFAIPLDPCIKLASGNGQPK